jgi:hypothetical protein
MTLIRVEARQRVHRAAAFHCHNGATQDERPRTEGNSFERFRVLRHALPRHDHGSGVRRQRSHTQRPDGVPHCGTRRLKSRLSSESNTPYRRTAISAS